MISAENTLRELARIGQQFGNHTPLSLLKSDPNRATIRFMILGAARAAYKRIKDGDDPVDVLYRLENFADSWWTEWPELWQLLDRVTIEADL